jgi:hypothetical protein
VAGSASSSKSASVVLLLFPFPSMQDSNFENQILISNLDLTLPALQGKAASAPQSTAASVRGSASSSASFVLPLFPFSSIAVSNFEILNLDFES